MKKDSMPGRIELFKDCVAVKYAYGWELHRFREKGDAPKHMKDKVKDGLACDVTYHGTLEQVCIYAFHSGMEGCKTLGDLLTVMKHHKEDIINSVRAIDRNEKA